jgi:rod shape-determining protein MreC
MSWHIRLIILVALVVLVLVTVSVNSDPRQRSSGPERMILQVVASLQQGVSGSARGVEGFWRSYFYLVNLRQENRELSKSLALANQRIVELNEHILANQRLRNLLNFADGRNFPFIGANVVAWDPGPWFKSINIDRGAEDGLRIGMPVISDQGVVGRVVDVAPNFAKVLLIIDFNSAIDAFVQRSRVRGILAGRSEKNCALKYALKNDDVVRGDLIVTSGLGGVFPRGLPLGRVTRVNKTGQDIFLEIDVTPMTEFNRLEEILVILTERAPF